jgi:hypothetical protein
MSAGARDGNMQYGSRRGNDAASSSIGGGFIVMIRQ